MGDTFEDLKRKMIPFAVMKPDRQLLHGIAAPETSIGRITPAERQASLSCIFDSVAEVAVTISSPEQIAPPRRDSSKIVTVSTPEASTRSNKSNYSLKESLRSIRSTPSKIFIQADFENDATIASGREDLPIAFLPKNMQLETCCHVVANQMMRKIIDDFKVDRNV